MQHEEIQRFFLNEIANVYGHNRNLYGNARVLYKKTLVIRCNTIYYITEVEI